ncbi:MAG: biotin/lipoyl-containing protein [Pyrinomonadaceae bacterium]
MKLTADINGEQISIDIERQAEPHHRVVAKVGDKLLELIVSEPEPGGCVLVSDGVVYECRVEADAQSEVSQVHLKGRVYRIGLFDPKRLRATAAGPGGRQLAGASTVKAPMPGKVLRVLTEVGASVEAGAGVIVIEAMKMQNELKATTAGTVTELRVAAGATVKAGDVLIVIE